MIMAARKPKAPGAKPASRKKEQVVLTRGKRKESVARARARKGSGRVSVNKFSLATLQPAYMRSLVSEPIEMAGDLAKDVDIAVNVYGGGVMGQAEAARMAIARALVKFTGSEDLKSRMKERDPFLLIEDSRRVEPKKYLGPKARARFQKSYR